MQDRFGQEEERRTVSAPPPPEKVDENTMYANLSLELCLLDQIN